MIAAYGDFVFDMDATYIYTFDELTMGTSYETEIQELAEGQKPSTYKKGPALEELSFKIKLNATQGVDVRTEIEGWKDACRKGSIQIFNIGGVPVSQYPYLLESVDVADTEILANGTFLKASLSLKFKEYVRAGTKKENSASYGADESLKRNNPNM
jgi:hypothetical protein